MALYSETLPQSGKVSPLGPSALGRDDGYSGLNPDSFKRAVFTSTSVLMKAAKSLGPRAVGTIPSDVVLAMKAGSLETSAIAKEPKKYFFALSSGGSAGHIATLAFLKRTGLPLDTILYKGTAPANTDLMAGNVQLFMDPWTATLPLATSGRARGLFVTSKERTQLAPNIPTADEVGLKDFFISSWYGLWAPKDTPDPVVDKLASAMAEVSKDPAFIAKTTSLGIVPTARGPKEFAAFIKAEVEINTALLKESGFKPE